jgi:hypothetical protein
VKRSLGVVAGLATLLLVTEASADSVQSMTINWILPTTTIDGTPLTGTLALTKVQFWVSTSPIPDTAALPPGIELPAGALTRQQSITVPSGGTVYVRIKACNAQDCSPMTAEASKSFPVGPPNMPTNVTITVNIKAPVP